MSAALRHLTREEQVDAGRIALEALRLHLIGLVDVIPDAESRKLLLALAEVETAGRILDELAKAPKAEAPPPAAPAGGSADSMLSDVHSYLSDARDVAGLIAQSQMGRQSTVEHEDLVKLLGSLHGAEQALDMVIDGREVAGG